MDPAAVTAIMTSVGTGYSDSPRPSGALASAVSAGGSPMLSALLLTKAIPRSTHIVPSVMMNGCTPSPTTINPLTTPQSSPTPTDMTRPVTAPDDPSRPWVRSTIAVVTPASA